jgi:hypothetical protein
MVDTVGCGSRSADAPSIDPVSRGADPSIE